ncbi:MAG TPA: outer membrane protein assembly factor BamE [Gemmobacter sp.]|nr:MAG: cell envelope protein SmpA [Rhodobacteraceae bacterium GWF1_65_7]HBD91568.1 outer membrane protein assembly factor BamE [Gemmobacter sp.]HBU15955.1 outer membrane protein assembly factor BamE [Gemmobacter sp.]
MTLAGKDRRTGTAQAGAGRLRRLGLWLCGGLLAVSLAACSAVFRDHGYVPTEEELAAVAVGQDTRESVAEKVGRPSATGLLNDVGWFYVKSRWRHYGAMAPQEIDRQVLAITFTESGTVQNIERYGLEDGQIVNLSRRVTDTNIKGISFIRQIMGNLGRMRATDVIQ